MDNKKFVIKQLHDGSYLAERSASRGSQAGIARIWCWAISEALVFNTAREAEECINQEWSEHARKYAGVFVQQVT